jgi:homogentisate 1,2-dioxygenase
MPKRAASSDGDAPKRGKADAWQTLQYMSGFGNEFATELLPGVLPKGQNSPQIVSRRSACAKAASACFLAPNGQ